MKKLKPKSRKVSQRISMTAAQSHDETFKLLMARFDRVDEDNKEIKEQIEKHVDSDALVHKVVERHGTYWGLLIGLGAPFILGVVAWFQGLFK